MLYVIVAATSKSRSQLLKNPTALSFIEKTMVVKVISELKPLIRLNIFQKLTPLYDRRM